MNSDPVPLDKTVKGGKFPLGTEQLQGGHSVSGKEETLQDNASLIFSRGQITGTIMLKIGNK